MQGLIDEFSALKQRNLSLILVIPTMLCRQAAVLSIVICLTSSSVLRKRQLANLLDDLESGELSTRKTLMRRPAKVLKAP